jgi:hypothetical protein
MQEMNAFDSDTVESCGLKVINKKKVSLGSSYAQWKFVKIKTGLAYRNDSSYSTSVAEPH